MILGLPRSSSRNLEDSFSLEAEVVDYHWSPEEIEVTLSGINVGPYTITYKIDPRKDFAVTEYETVTRRPTLQPGEQDVYRVIGKSRLERFNDGIWFPRFHRREQYKNGVFQHAQEFHVDKALLNGPIKETLFEMGGDGHSRRG